MGMNVSRLVADGWEREMRERAREQKEKEGMEESVDEDRGSMEQVPIAGKSSGEEI